RRQGGGLARVSPESNHPQKRLPAAHLGERRESAVTAGVVHGDHLEASFPPPQHLEQLRQQRVDVHFFVEQGNHHPKLRRIRQIRRYPPCPAHFPGSSERHLSHRRLTRSYSFRFVQSINGLEPLCWVRHPCRYQQPQRWEQHQGADDAGDLAHHRVPAKRLQGPVEREQKRS